MAKKVALIMYCVLTVATIAKPSIIQYDTNIPIALVDGNASMIVRVDCGSTIGSYLKVNNNGSCVTFPGSYSIGASDYNLENITLNTDYNNTAAFLFKKLYPYTDPWGTRIVSTEFYIYYTITDLSSGRAMVEVDFDDTNTGMRIGDIPTLVNSRNCSFATSSVSSSSMFDPSSLGSTLFYELELGPGSNPDTQDYHQFGSDFITVDANLIPEPATLSLLALCGLAPLRGGKKQIMSLI